MRFGLYFELQCPPGKDHAQVYREAMQQAALQEAGLSPGSSDQ